MTRPVVITCALTGGGDTTKKSPHVPITPAQIANEALAARKAGAAVVHIHVRDPKTGMASSDRKLYREVVERIRESGSDVLINLTTGPGGRVNPNDEDRTRLGEGSTLMSPEDRVAHVLELRPDICSLDVATMNYGELAFVNVPRDLKKMASLIREVGVKPELEVYDLGHTALALELVRTGHIESPPLFQFCLDIRWGAPATAEALITMRNMLSPGTAWSAFGIAASQLPTVALATLLGGNVRVGLEDNLYIAKGRLAPGNASLVEGAARILESMGYTVATPAEARKIFDL